MKDYRDEFKAKYAFNDHWIVGGLTHDCQSGYSIVKDGSSFAVDPETICQKSGIRDDNDRGVMLYTNDIVYIAGKGNLVVDIDVIDGVVFRDKNGNIEETAGDAIMEGDIGKRLGNIFDNPEIKISGGSDVGYKKES